MPASTITLDDEEIALPGPRRQGNSSTYAHALWTQDSSPYQNALDLETLNNSNLNQDKKADDSEADAKANHTGVQFHGWSRSHICSIVRNAVIRCPVFFDEEWQFIRPFLLKKSDVPPNKFLSIINSYKVPSHYIWSLMLPLYLVSNTLNIRSVPTFVQCLEEGLPYHLYLVISFFKYHFANKMCRFNIWFTLCNWSQCWHWQFSSDSSPAQVLPEV